MKKILPLTITYDKEADAAYVYLTPIASGEAQETYTCDDLPQLVKGDINIDFDKDGRLLGFEVLNASKTLPESVLKSLALD